MSLDKPPPSRYRVEEKDGRLIVHDSMASAQLTSNAPAPQPRSGLDGASLTATSMSRPSGPKSAGLPSGDTAKAKRGGTVAAFAIILGVVLIATGLWPILVLAFIIPPVRKQLLGNLLPGVKRYIDEGRVS